MTAAREKILQNVTGALGRPPSDSSSIAAEARALIEEPAPARPELPSAGVVESFLERIAGPKVAATAERITHFESLPEAVARYLGANELQAHIALQPTSELAACDWAGAGVVLGNTVDEGIAVGLARWGIAETGSVIFHSGAETPILLSFLPAIQIVAVRANQIVSHLEDYASAARADGDPAPRNACLITGASGTTDIEGSLVTGAHGPRELHVIVIDDVAASDRAIA